MPMYVASATASTRTDGDTVGITVTHGFTLADNDVLYAFVTRSDDAGTEWISTGWTQVTGLNSAFVTGNDRLSTCLRKVITNAAGEPSTYTFMTSGVSGSNTQTAVIVQVRGADTAAPEDAIATHGNVSNDFTPDADGAGALTVVTAGSLGLIMHAASMNDLVSGKTAGAPSGWTIAGSDEEIFSGALGSFIEVAYLENLSAGAQTIGVWTGTPDDATSEATLFCLAVKPADIQLEPDIVMPKMYPDVVVQSRSRW